MEPAFWHERWKNKRIGFHEGAPNSFLMQYFERLTLQAASRVFVPLCGRAVDLHWIADQGHFVVGIELNESAVAEFFGTASDVGIERLGDLTRYRSGSVEIFVGDFFDLTNSLLGAVDAIYDRAALVALPPDMRQAYTKHLVSLTNAAPQLLVTLDYDQAMADGPPFSVPAAEIDSHYAAHYRMDLLARVDMDGPIAKRCSGDENAWLLSRR